MGDEVLLMEPPLLSQFLDMEPSNADQCDYLPAHIEINSIIQNIIDRPISINTSYTTCVRCKVFRRHQRWLRILVLVQQRELHSKQFSSLETPIY